MSNPFLILSDSPSTIYKDILECVLLCTVNDQPTIPAVYLADLATSLPDNWDKNFIDQALFERLHSSDPSNQFLTPTNNKSTNRTDTNVIVENRCLHYLAGCYQRLLKQRVSYSVRLISC